MGMEKKPWSTGDIHPHTSHTPSFHINDFRFFLLGITSHGTTFRPHGAFPLSIFDTQATHLIFRDPFSLLSFIRHQTPFAD